MCSRRFAKLVPAVGVAQLGERRVRNAKVGSSILLLSTIRQVQQDPEQSREDPKSP